MLQPRRSRVAEILPYILDDHHGRTLPTHVTTIGVQCLPLSFTRRPQREETLVHTEYSKLILLGVVACPLSLSYRAQSVYNAAKAPTRPLLEKRLAPLWRYKPKDDEHLMSVDPELWADHADGEKNLTIGQASSNLAESIMDSMDDRRSRCSIATSTGRPYAGL